MSWEKSVFSSNVESIGFNSDTGEMTVRWTTGKVSAYQGVPEDLADEISRSYSVGSMIASEIKGKFSHRYVG